MTAKKALRADRKSAQSRVLVIDDDAAIGEALKVALEMAGYDVHTTVKGELAMALVSKLRPRLILVDLLLSGNDGRVLTQQLKADPQTRHIPVVMLSAHLQLEKAAKESGADGFLAKPFAISDLIAMVMKVTR